MTWVIALTANLADCPVQGGSATESTQQDIVYWRQRVLIEQAAARSAPDPRAARVHEVMATRYETWIDRASMGEPRAA